MRVPLFIALLTVLPAAACLANAQPTVKPAFYVSLLGNNAWSGKLDVPNAAGTDGPFATIDRAREAVRALKTQSGHKGPIIVAIRGGAYYLSQPLEFTPEDSGPSAERPVIYTAYANEQPVISGGVPLTGMRKNALDQWEMKLADVESGKWYFSQLYVNGERRMRPRLPKYGYYRIAGAVSPPKGAAGYDSFIYSPGELHPDWFDLSSVEALCFQTWTMTALRIASIDDASRLVHFTGHTAGTEGYASLPKGNRYIIENVREALQDPGEWYLNRKTGQLLYLPIANETPGRTEIVAPRLEQLLLLKGDVPGRRWVENIIFRSITFAHTGSNTPPEGSAYPQAEVNLSAAISANGARHCSFMACTVKHTGAWAIELGAGCRDDTVESCELTDLGAGGVKLGETGIPGDAEMAAGANIVRNCLICHGGRTHPAAVGVWIGQSGDNQVLHNRITDFYYTGISAGWTWGYGKSLATGNKISYNMIDTIGQGVLSDMGGIYTLGVSPGTVEDHNVIHDVDSYDYGGWGIYTDEGSSGIAITNNVVYRTKTGGFHQHYGKENEVSNNVFAFSREGQIIRTRAEEHLSFIFQHNIVLYNSGDLLGSNWTGDQFKMDYNDYWDESGRPVTFAGETLAEWNKRGQDVHSIIADPMFTNPADAYFRLKIASPALALGIKSIDVSQVGPHPVGGIRQMLTDAPRAFPPPPPPQAPAPIDEDFETTQVGQKAPDAITSEEEVGGTARVTDETASSGKHSLKFQDAAGQKFAYNPHVYWQPKFETGKLEGSFALKLLAGAQFSHEWRDNANPYHAGPSIQIDGKGAVSTNGISLGSIPLNAWVHFAIECTIGDRATGSFSVLITLPDGTFRHYMDLPCSPDFKKITWYGFVSNTDGPSVFYLDEVKLSQ